MGTLENAASLAAKIQAINAEVLAAHIQRNDVVKATWLSLVSGRPAFFLGSPGVDKTGTIQAMARRIEVSVFYDALMPTITSVEQLLVESTSIREMPAENGGRSIETSDKLGRAALAHLLFADEIWKSEPRVLQTLLDLAKGDGVRHEGHLVKTPLLAFLSASNELPDAEGNLGAVWSRMTIRVVVNPLDRAGKTALVKARLNRDRGGKKQTASLLTLADIATLRDARPQVEISGDIISIVLDLYEDLLSGSSGDFQWLWDDDRRFGRCFDVMQANALLAGRTAVTKQDLAVLEWMLWDTPEQIPVVKAKLAPYTRTPLSDAKEQVDCLLAPGGNVQIALSSNQQAARNAATQAITKCDICIGELRRLLAEATDDMKQPIVALGQQIEKAKSDIMANILGTRTF